MGALGQVAPTLSGCGHPHLHRFQLYEDYEPYLLPARISERSAELKLNLAWLADSAGWPPEMVAAVSRPAADLSVSKLSMRDIHDWRGASVKSIWGCVLTVFVVLAAFVFVAAGLSQEVAFRQNVRLVEATRLSSITAELRLPVWRRINS